MPNWDILKKVGDKQKQASGLDEAKVLKLIAGGQSHGKRLRPTERRLAVAADDRVACLCQRSSRPRRQGDCFWSTGGINAPQDEEEADQAPLMDRQRPGVEELDLTAMVDVTFLWSSSSC